MAGLRRQARHLFAVVAEDRRAAACGPLLKTAAGLVTMDAVPYAPEKGDEHREGVDNVGNDQHQIRPGRLQQEDIGNLEKNTNEKNRSTQSHRRHGSWAGRAALTCSVRKHDSDVDQEGRAAGGPDGGIVESGEGKKHGKKGEEDGRNRREQENRDQNGSRVLTAVSFREGDHDTREARDRDPHFDRARQDHVGLK